jgi:putative endonuclease
VADIFIFPILRYFNVGFGCKFALLRQKCCTAPKERHLISRLRKNENFAAAREYVDRKKQDRIRVTASVYLSQNPTQLIPRFDVIEIYAPDGAMTKKPVINHLEDAFE